MCPQRTLNVDPSVRLMKFFWWLMEEGEGGVTFTYLQKDPAEINVKATFYNLHNVIDWLPPYTPGPAKLRILLRCTASYLSRGNVSGPLDDWIEAVEGPDIGQGNDLWDGLPRGEG